MRSHYLTFFLTGLSCYSSGQSKTVKLEIDSTSIYFRYFYQSKHGSDYILNDSVRFAGRKITDDKFYLDKYIHRKKVWSRIYKIELASDSLLVTTHTSGSRGKSKFNNSKRPYYNSILIDK